VTIRILADCEPYASFGSELFSSEEGPPWGALSVYQGPPALDEADPDLIVLSAEDFLELRVPARESASREGVGFIAFGPISLMAAAFAAGASDYLREPWIPAELRARAQRLVDLQFLAGSETFVLRKGRLSGSHGKVELQSREIGILRALVARAPLPVPLRELEKLAGRRSFDSLRRKLRKLDPGLGTCLHIIRGLGYRFDVQACG
jgi:DNA-binding response OmpR family regulator